MKRLVGFCGFVVEEEVVLKLREQTWGCICLIVSLLMWWRRCKNSKEKPHLLESISPSSAQNLSRHGSGWLYKKATDDWSDGCVYVIIFFFLSVVIAGELERKHIRHRRLIIEWASRWTKSREPFLVDWKFRWVKVMRTELVTCTNKPIWVENWKPPRPNC